MRDLERARRLLEAEGFTCVLVRGDVIYTSRETGIRPMVGWLTRGVELSGFSAADRIVGKAAAMLFALAGVEAVHGQVLSQKGAAVLEERRIPYTCAVLAEEIINRQGTGPCPMELAVREIHEPAAALEAVKDTLARLSGKN